MLVQHMHEVPESLPVTEETQERLRAQANQLGEATVVRLIDLLAVAVDDMRQGGDPRLPLELALVKVTRPAADLSRESTAYRLEQLETRGVPVAPPVAVAEESPLEVKVPVAVGAPPDVELEQLQEAWARTIVPAVAERSIPTSSLLGDARPAELDGDTLTVEFAPSASFKRTQAEDPKNVAMLRDALYEVTGRKLTVEFVVGEGEDDEAELDEPAGEEQFLQLIKETFDATERETE
jgi:DNA polymerase-3 subunit gamma/tau